MQSPTAFQLEHNQNPLDELERFFSENEWPCSRTSKFELSANIKGGWTDYYLSFSWNYEVNAIYFLCVMPFAFSKSDINELHRLTSMINNSLGMGHFEVEKQCVTFRHTIPVRGLKNVPIAMLQDLIDVALNECERFFPSFNLLTAHNYSVEKALSSALSSSIGNA